MGHVLDPAADQQRDVGRRRRAITSAISRSASSALGAWTSTTRAPSTRSAASGELPVAAGQAGALGVAGQRQLADQQVLVTRTSEARCSATAPRVSAP